jgi:ATP-dependent DNA helicase RecG
MPSAIENLVKILNLEKEKGYQDTAVIGGMSEYVLTWESLAREQARRPEQQALVAELLLALADFSAADHPSERKQHAEYILGRIMRRLPIAEKYRLILAEQEAAIVLTGDEEEDIPPLESAPPQRSQDKRSERRAKALRPEEKGGKRAKATPPPASPTPRRDNRDWLFSKTDSPPPRRNRRVEDAKQVVGKPRRRKRPSLPLQVEQQALAQLDAPLTVLDGVGPSMADKLARLGLATVGDLLYFFPRRYDDYRQMLPLNRLEPYQQVTIVGTIQSIHQRVGRGKTTIQALRISDGTGYLDLNFFNQPWLLRRLKIGMQLVFSGKTDYFNGRLVMNNPAWDAIDQQSLATGRIVPVYPLTEGLTAKAMRRLVHAALDRFGKTLPDFLPQSVLNRANLVDLNWALQQVHFPETQDYIAFARERLAFDELLLLQLRAQARRREWQSVAASPLTLPENWLDRFQSALPFRLTGAQVRAIEKIAADLALDVPMNRLLQGDVGAGKTLVAAFALAVAALNGKQGALMVPTNILAEQHFQKIQALFAQIPELAAFRVALLTGSISENARRETYAGLADGSIAVVVGTQALIQERLEFADLALAVIDEQHRFGVEQRATLRSKGFTNPHVLVMTATPIPRTLALSLFADLDLAILDELPPGRTPIVTKLITPDKRQKAYDFLLEKVLAQGQQAYIIYPLVEASETSEAESAIEGYERLRRDVFDKYQVGLVHGRLKPAEKEAVMGAFARGDLQVLVSTTVIEVGVDVPNATAILIENAERFGLAQLHQLRGRVGRGAQESYCLLISHEKTPRLQALVESTDGFELARRDWLERGAGDLLGLRQSGPSAMRLASYMDEHLVELAQKEAKTLNLEDPLLELPEHRLLAGRVLAHPIESREVS